MKLSLVAAVLATVALTEGAVNVIGMKLPELKDKALDGAVTSLPGDVKGYVTVIAFAFKRESQADIDEWLAASPPDLSDARRFRMYEMPMMGGGLVKLFSASSGEILLQRCSGRMGIHSPSMFALGLEQVKTTWVASGASTLSMNLT